MKQPNQITRLFARASIALVLLGISSTSAMAWTSYVEPDGAGGYTTYGPNGRTYTERDGGGGYTTYGPHGSRTYAEPDGGGGYTVHGYGSDPTSPPPVSRYGDDYGNSDSDGQ